MRSLKGWANRPSCSGNGRPRREFVEAKDLIRRRVSLRQSTVQQEETLRLQPSFPSRKVFHREAFVDEHWSSGGLGFLREFDTD